MKTSLYTTNSNFSSAEPVSFNDPLHMPGYQPGSEPHIRLSPAAVRPLSVASLSSLDRLFHPNRQVCHHHRNMSGHTVGHSRWSLTNRSEEHTSELQSPK